MTGSLAAYRADPLPGAVLFCCDHNAVRSPMAEGIMKKLYGTEAYVQSAGLVNDLEIDGFAIAVCAEIGVELSRHRSRSFDEMRRRGESLSSFDLVLALSTESERAVREIARADHVAVEGWPILDPTGTGETREERLVAYRRTRDMILGRLIDRWGPASTGAWTLG